MSNKQYISCGDFGKLELAIMSDLYNSEYTKEITKDKDEIFVDFDFSALIKDIAKGM